MVYTDVCIYTHIYINVCIHTFFNICVCIYMYICVYTNIYAYIHRRKYKWYHIDLFTTKKPRTEPCKFLHIGHFLQKNPKEPCKEPCKEPPIIFSPLSFSRVALFGLFCGKCPVFHVVATVSRIDKIICLFGRIPSLL